MRENMRLSESVRGSLADGQPLISVIVPVHNGQDYLENCIKSILGQTYQPVEIVLIDDGSTDRTGSLCEKLQSAHENIVLITMEDLGVSAARNAGLLKARGAYVTFVDADDRIHPRMLEVLYENLVRTKSDVAGCRFFLWQTEEDWEKKTASGMDDARYDGRKAGSCPGAESVMETCSVFSQKQFVLEGILKNDTRCWSKLYKRECIQDVRFREGLTIGEDMLFLVDMLSHVKKSVSVDFEGYGYFQNPNGAMNRAFKPSYMDQITCWKLAGEKLAEWMKEQDCSGKLTAQEKAFAAETVAGRLMIGIMLTVGKLAELPGRSRREYEGCLDICRRELGACMADKKGFDSLDRSYRYKVKLFHALPHVYVRLYGTLKRLMP